MALYRYICMHCRKLCIRCSRNRYADVVVSYLSYCKKRKRKASRSRMLKRRMIRLLEKLIIQRDDIHREYGSLLKYTQDYQKRFSIIRRVLVQEKEPFESRKVSDRIVSIDRQCTTYRKGQGYKSCRVRCKGWQHTDKRDLIHQAHLFQGIQ